MKALIAEDESILASDIKTILEQESFDGDRFEIIDIATNGAVALKLIKNDYDIVILDLKMPQVDGTQIIEALQLIPILTRPWVILITAFPADYEAARIAVKMEVRAYLEKPFELSALMGVIREVIRNRRQLLEYGTRDTRSQCQWTLALNDIGTTAFVQVKGLWNFADCCIASWSGYDLQVANQHGMITGKLANTANSMRHHWRFYAKDTGSSLFKKLFIGAIQSSFVAAGTRVLHSHDLRMTFIGPRGYLNLPLETLNDNGDYLVLKHPIRRFVSGVHPEAGINGSINITDILSGQRTGEKVKILLVASNTPPLIDGIDEEVAALYDLLSNTLPKDHFVVDYIPTEKATYDEIIDRLTDCCYHFLHYAGHGCHNEKFPGKSEVYFWEKENLQGEHKALTATAIKNVLRMKGHRLQFAYFSCCSSARTSDESTLLNDDFLGITDTLIHAGVPSVLGFRWPVSDEGATVLALSFYKSLFEQGDIDMALFQARCKLNSKNPDSGDWLSPILIVQG